MRQILLSLLQKLTKQLIHPKSLPLIDVIAGAVVLALGGVIGVATQAFRDSFQIDPIIQTIAQIGVSILMVALILIGVLVMLMTTYLIWLKFRTSYAKEQENIRRFQETSTKKQGIETESKEKVLVTSREREIT